MSDKTIQALKRIDLLADLPEPLISQLAQFSLIRRVRAGETIFCQGEPSPYCFGIVSGQVTIQFIPKDRHYAPKTLAILGPGSLFGESSLFDDSPRTAMGQASQDGELVCITGAKFREWIRTEQSASVPFLMDLLKGTLQRLRQTSNELTVVYGTSRLLQNYLPYEGRMKQAAEYVRSSIPGIDSILIYARSPYWEEFEAVAQAPLMEAPAISLQHGFIRFIENSSKPIVIMAPNEMHNVLLKGLPWENDLSLAVIPLYENVKEKTSWVGFMLVSSRTQALAFPHSTQILLSAVAGQFLDELRRSHERDDHQAQQRLQQSRNSFPL